MRAALLFSVALGARAAQQRGKDAQQASSQWHDASFFDSFQTGESTWNYDGAQVLRAEDNPFHQYVDGWNPDVTNPFDAKEVDPLAFASLPGGGQDFQGLPEPKSGLLAHDQDTGSWYANSEGNDIESYKYPDKNAEQAQTLQATAGDVFHLMKGSGAKQANWFDASVAQYDAYGRPKYPYPGNPELLISQGYQEQAANVSLSCKKAGCNATATLSLGQNRSELQKCRLSVQVRPTDFGPDKVVEFIKVNDRLVSLNCQPRTSGKCEEATELGQLHTCVDDVDVQHLLSSTGTLDISAKISDSVNSSSCAYNGNLLYAVPQLACLVGRQPDHNTTGFQDLPASKPVDLALRQQTTSAKLALAQEHVERGLRVRKHV